jgi:hypothetical protein
MTIEFDEGERTWARNNDQAERDSDIAYQQEQDEDKKFFVEWGKEKMPTTEGDQSHITMLVTHTSQIEWSEIK